MVKLYTAEDLKIDINWLTDGYISESEAKKFIIFLLNCENGVKE